MDENAFCNRATVVDIANLAVLASEQRERFSTDVANIAESLSMKCAYELDGGGSTTMWMRSGGGKWTRRDLYGVNTRVCACERPMTNGLAFVK